MNAFRNAQMGRNPKVATSAQMLYLRSLSDRLGIEMPRVTWAKDASGAIKALKDNEASRAQTRLEVGA